MTMGIFPRLCELAFADLSVYADTLGADFDQFLESKLKEELNWHKVASVRYRGVQRSLQCKQENFVLTVLLVVLEPLDMLTYHFLASGNQLLTFDKYPSLMEILWGPRSILTQVQQYYSSMLSGTCGRLRLIWQRTGSSSFKEWADRFPDDALYVRRVISTASCLVERNHCTKLLSEPWSIFMVGDLRRACGERLDYCQTFVDTPSCCHPFGMARDIHARVGSADEMIALGPMLRTLAWMILLSLGAVERLHARGRKSADPQSVWAAFASNFINSEVKELSNGRRKIAKMLRDSDSRKRQNHTHASGVRFVGGRGQVCGLVGVGAQWSISNFRKNSIDFALLQKRTVARGQLVFTTEACELPFEL